MIFRRSESTPPPPSAPSWQPRFDAAATMLRANVSASWVEGRIAEVHRALIEADTDEVALATSINQLAPEQTSRSLKDTLRQQQLSGTFADPTLGAQIRALRQRFETANTLLNRCDELRARRASALADFEVLAVQAVGVTAASCGGDDPAGDDPLAHHIEQLAEDLEALRDAHDEIRSL